MAAIRTTTTTTLLKQFAFQNLRTATVSNPKRVPAVPEFLNSTFSDSRRINYGGIRFTSKKPLSRLSQVQQLLLEADGRANETSPPKIRLEHVSVSVAKSGGPGGQHASAVDTKVEMRFNVKKATWLSEQMRDKILLLEKKKINKNGEIVFSSKKTRTQQGNIVDCLSKIQAILNAAAYVPPPLSEEHMKCVSQLVAESQQKRLLSKKTLLQKKLF